MCLARGKQACHTFSRINFVQVMECHRTIALRVRQTHLNCDKKFICLRRYAVKTLLTLHFTSVGFVLKLMLLRRQKINTYLTCRNHHLHDNNRPSMNLQSSSRLKTTFLALMKHLIDDFCYGIDMNRPEQRQPNEQKKCPPQNSCISEHYQWHIAILIVFLQAVFSGNPCLCMLFQVFLNAV